MSDHRATIEMLAADAGGLKSPMMTPTPSLLLSFPDQEEQAEAMIHTVDGGRLVPGCSYEARFEFWNPASEAEARAGRKFELWHGRVVGSGCFH